MQIGAPEPLDPDHIQINSNSNNNSSILVNYQRRYPDRISRTHVKSHTRTSQYRLQYVLHTFTSKWYTMSNVNVAKAPTKDPVLDINIAVEAIIHNLDGAEMEGWTKDGNYRLISIASKR